MPLLSKGEQSVFMRQMAFRFFVAVWAIYSLLVHSVDKAIVEVLLLACLLGMGETVFGSLMAWARIQAVNEENRIKHEAAEAKKQAALVKLKQAQAEAAVKYLDVAEAG